MRTPSASSTSALPQVPLAERLPCLATGTPQAAITSEATVEKTLHDVQLGDRERGAGCEGVEFFATVDGTRALVQKTRLVQAVEAAAATKGGAQ